MLRRLTQPHLLRRAARASGAAALTAALSVAAACAPPPTTDAAGTRHLTMADSFALKHPVGKNGTQVFLDDVAAQNPQRGTHLSIDYFASGQLGKQADIPSVVRSGIADLAVISPAYVSSIFPLAGIGDLPGFGDDSCVTASALRDITKPGTLLYDTEFAPMKFRPLWTGSIPGYEAMGNSADSADPRSYAGKVLRSTGGALDRVISELGAAGVAMPIGDLYEAISRGTVEGTLASPISITPYGLEEVLTHSTYGADQGSFTFVYGINTDTWNQLTPQQQKLLQDAADKAQQSVCVGLNKARDTSIAAMKKAGVTFHDVGAHREAWQAVAEPVKRKWVEAGESQGLPARQVMEEFTAAINRHESATAAASTRKEDKQ